MNLQLIKDSHNKDLGVFINIEDWKLIKTNLSGLLKTDKKSKRINKHLLEFEEALIQLKKIEKGELKSRPAKELLDEL